jgi:hypothetical protein
VRQGEEPHEGADGFELRGRDPVAQVQVAQLTGDRPDSRGITDRGAGIEERLRRVVLGQQGFGHEGISSVGQNAGSTIQIE